MGIVLQRQGRFDEARLHLLEALRLNPHLGRATRALKEISERQLLR